MPKMTPHDGWRQTHMGHLMHRSLQRFDARVLALMATDDTVPLALSNLAARGRLSASHTHVVRHLALVGMRLTELAACAGMTKQAMGKLVDQCEAWALVMREPDPTDARAIRVQFTDTGRVWLAAFRRAVAQAENELRVAVGAEVAVVIQIGLEAYAA